MTRNRSTTETWFDPPRVWWALGAGVLVVVGGAAFMDAHDITPGLMLGGVLASLVVAPVAAVIAYGLVDWQLERRERLRWDPAIDAGLAYVMNQMNIMSSSVGVAAFYGANPNERYFARAADKAFADGKAVGVLDRDVFDDRRGDAQDNLISDDMRTLTQQFLLEPFTWPEPLIDVCADAAKHLSLALSTVREFETLDQFPEHMVKARIALDVFQRDARRLIRGAHGRFVAACRIVAESEPDATMSVITDTMPIDSADGMTLGNVLASLGKMCQALDGLCDAMDVEIAKRPESQALIDELR